jgi:hypothetical protein
MEQQLLALLHEHNDQFKGALLQVVKNAAGCEVCL